RVEGGTSLAEAMASEPDFFPSVYVKTVAAGEAAGKLAEVFDSLASFLEDAAETRSQVKSALMYPALVIVTLVIATVVLLLLVIPRFEEMFAKFSAQLPFPTRAVIAISNLLRFHWMEMLAGVGVFAFAYGAIKRDRRVQVWLDERKLKLPIF